MSMTKMFMEIAIWLSLNTGLDVDFSLPQIIWADECTIARGYNPNHSCEHVEIRATYDIKKKIMRIPLDLDPSNALDRSFVVHELVHHYQVWDKEPLSMNDCDWMEKEVEAYEIQREYISSLGFRFVGGDPIALSIMNYKLTCDEFRFQYE